VLKACGEGAPEQLVMEIVQLLLNLGASVNASGCETILLNFGSYPAYHHSRTPLYIAVEAGSAKAVQLLLDAGADPNVGYTLGVHTLEVLQNVKHAIMHLFQSVMQGYGRILSCCSLQHGQQGRMKAARPS